MNLSILIPAQADPGHTQALAAEYARHFASHPGGAEVLVVAGSGTGSPGSLREALECATGAWLVLLPQRGAPGPEGVERLSRAAEDTGAALVPVAGTAPDARRFARLARLLFGRRGAAPRDAMAVLRSDLARPLRAAGFRTDAAVQAGFLHLAARAAPAGAGTASVAAAGPTSGPAPSEELGALAGLVRARLALSPCRRLLAGYDRRLAPVLFPPGQVSDGLIRHSILLMIAAQVVNACNVFFQVAAMRLLTDADYSVLGAMLSLFGFFFMLQGAVGRGVTHFSALYASRGTLGGLLRLRRMVLSDILFAYLLLLGLILALRGPVVDFFRLHSLIPVLFIWLAATLFAVSQLWLSLLVGLQRFFLSSVVSMTQAATRFLGFLALGLLGWGCYGALAAHAGSYLVALLLGAWFILRPLQGDAADAELHRRAFYGYTFGNLLAWFAFSMLMNLDVIMAKHYLDASTAGAFAKVVLLSRMVIFLPMPVAGALFPKVVSDGTSTRRTGRTLTKGLLLVGAIVLSAALAATLIAPLLLRIVAADPASLPVFRLMLWALAPLSFVYLLLSYQLAQRRFALVLPLLACMAGYWLLLRTFNDSPRAIALNVALASTAALLCAVATMFRPFARRKA